MRKKGISPVVATALFLVITVISVIGFSQFLNSFESEVLSDIEQQESVNDIIIRDVVGSIAYIEAQKAKNEGKLEKHRFFLNLKEKETKMIKNIITPYRRAKLGESPFGKLEFGGFI